MELRTAVAFSYTRDCELERVRRGIRVQLGQPVRAAIERATTARRILVADWPNARRIVFGLAYLGFVWLVLRLAFARFCELRLKATEMAFQGMIALEHDPVTTN